MEPMSETSESRIPVGLQTGPIDGGQGETEG